MLRLYDAQMGPIELASALHPATGKPQRIQNYRQDKGGLSVRGGTSVFLSAPIGSLTLIDVWSGELNGTSYLVAGFLVGSRVAIYYSTGGNPWLELTQVGGYGGDSTGNSRFAHNTGRLTFAAIRYPGFTNISSSARDVLMIGNGQDYNLIWDPWSDWTIQQSGSLPYTLSISAVANSAGLIKVTTNQAHLHVTGDTVVIENAVTSGGMVLNGSWTITVTSSTAFTLNGSTYTGSYTSGGDLNYDMQVFTHQAPSIPSTINKFSATHFFKSFWGITGSTGTNTFYATAGPPKVNQTNFKLAETASAPYTGSNILPQLTWGASAAASDVATVLMPSYNLTPTGFILITEDNDSDWGADELISNCIIKLIRGTAYNAQLESVTIYDPSSSDSSLQQVVRVPLASPASENPRILWYFPTKGPTGGAGGSTGANQLSFTLITGAQAPGTTKHIQILGAMAAGKYPGTTQWWITYENTGGHAESAAHLSVNDQAVRLSLVGGPSAIGTGGALSSQSKYTLPIDTDVNYDFQFVIPNNPASSVQGGLGAIATYANLYSLTPNDSNNTSGFFDTNYGLWQADISGGYRGWKEVSSAALIVTDSQTLFISPAARDFTRPVPSDYQISVPPSKALLFANNRLFAGNIYDTTHSKSYAGDLYYSEYGQPFRFQAVIESATSGGRTVFHAERLEALAASAAEVDGRSLIYGITNRRLCSLGGSSSLVGSLYDANQISVIYTIAHRGTNSFRSVAISPDGSLFYLDNTGQIVRYQNGQPVPISKFKVDDKPASIPAARVIAASGAFHHDRYYLAYTPAASTTNDRILGWNDVMGIWEFDDLPPQPAERVVAYYDSSLNGDGIRMLLVKADGTVYDYDGAASDDLGSAPTIRFTTGDMPHADSPNPIQIDAVDLEADAQANSLTLHRVMRSPSGEYKTTISLANGWVTDENQAHAVVTPASGGEWSRGVQLDIQGQMSVGSSLLMVSANVRESSSRQASGS